jgi:glutamate carboxypeptidase
MDTVWPVGTLAERPWRVDGDRAFGPGSYDNKSSAAVILNTLHGLQDLGLVPVHPVTVLFNSDEEIGSRTSRAAIEAEAVRAQVVFCMEPALPDGALKVWRKGTGWYRVTALGRSTHAGSDHEKGVNAIEELARQVIRLQEMTDYVTGVTINVGRVQGGTRSNIVPDRAEASVDLRVRTAEQGARMDAAIKGLEPILPGARILVEGGLSRPPMEESPLIMNAFRRAQSIGAELDLALTATGTGGASDANFAAALGVPTLDGLGPAGDNAHSPDEYVLVPTLSDRSALLAALLTRW